MDHTEAASLINKKLAEVGKPPLTLTEMESRQAFASLQQYVRYSGRPFEMAIEDVVRFQIQEEAIRSN